MDFDFSKYQLKSQAFFDMLSKEEAACARKKTLRLEFTKGQQIIKEGTYSKGIYIIESGKVKIHSSSPEGKECIVYIYRRNEFFGYRPLVSNALNPVSATAMNDVLITFFPAEHFINLLETSVPFGRTLLASSTSEFSVWINKITLFSQHQVRERTAMALLLLCQVYQRGRQSLNTVPINISRDDLSAYVGSAKETVVRTLKTFKNDGIISSKGRTIKIVKPEVLHDYLKYV